MKKKFLILSCMFCCFSFLNGQQLDWVFSLGDSIGVTYSYGTVTDDSANVYVTGSFSGIVDFDPGPGVTNATAAGNTDIFIQKLTTSGTLVWIKTVGGIWADYGHDIAVDEDHNVVVTGIFRNTVDFDPGPGMSNSTASSQDIFTMKLNINGNFLWVATMGTGGITEGLSVDTDSAGNVYTAGYFDGLMDFDPGPGVLNLPYNNDDLFIQKLDASGNLVWATATGSTNSDRCYSVSVAPDGSVLATGRFSLTVDFDPGPGVFNCTSDTLYDIFIWKLDAGGNLAWVKTIGGPYHEWGSSITTDANDNTYVLGFFTDTMDFDPGPGTYNLIAGSGGSTFILKLDPNGNFVWARDLHVKTDYYGQGIAVDQFQNVYFTGNFNGTTDFDPGLGVYNRSAVADRDIFIEKLNPSGTFLWAVSMGGTSLDLGFSLAVDAQQSVYAVGYFHSPSVDFDPGPGTYVINSVEVPTMYVIKLTPTIKDGIDETENHSAVESYPVPGSSIVHFSIEKQNDPVYVELWSVTGTLIRQEMIAPQQTPQIDISALASGAYFAVIRYGDQTGVARIVKE